MDLIIEQHLERSDDDQIVTFDRRCTLQNRRFSGSIRANSKLEASTQGPSYSKNAIEITVTGVHGDCDVKSHLRLELTSS